MPGHRGGYDKMTVSDAPARPARRRTGLAGNRDFLLLWIGSGFSALGARATSIGYTLLVFWSTGSATAASLVTFAALLPNLVAQLPAGALVDRWNRRTTMLACTVVRVAGVGSVAVVVLLDAVWLPHLMFVAFVEATLGICYTLAERAAVGSVVPRDQLGAATAANESRANAASILGQPAGTVLYSVARFAPFLFATVAHLISLVTLLFMRRDLRAPRAAGAAPGRLLAEIKEGFDFVWGQLYLRRALCLFAASNILFQILGLGLVVLVKERGGEPATVGLLLVVNSVFGMLGAMTSNVYLRRWGIRRMMIGINVGWAVLMPLLVVAPGLIVVSAILALINYGAGIGNVAGMLYLLKTAPDELRGRAGSIFTLLASGANAAGALLAGFLLDHLGIEVALVIVGATMVVIAIFAVLAFGTRAAAEAERAEAAAEAAAEAERLPTPTPADPHPHPRAPAPQRPRPRPRAPRAPRPRAPRPAPPR
ncbi:MFS transporter [Micromonospora sp. FIMYZ51]|uniref:MFS transporter n=1 Tax=Micromonospora sp. FIMYZ51 TaxID=3051832 RepID=UPI00311EA2F4